MDREISGLDISSGVEAGRSGVSQMPSTFVTGRDGWRWEDASRRISGGDEMAPYVIVEVGSEWHVAKLVKGRIGPSGEDVPPHYYSSFHCRNIDVAKEILTALQNTANKGVL